MITTLDLGVENNVHPHNKKPVGLRLANLALADVYGWKIPAHPPRAISVRRNKQEIVLTLACDAGVALWSASRQAAHRASKSQALTASTFPPPPRRRKPDPGLRQGSRGARQHPLRGKIVARSWGVRFPGAAIGTACYARSPSGLSDLPSVV